MRGTAGVMVLLGLGVGGCGAIGGVCDDLEWPDLVLRVTDEDGVAPATVPAIRVDGQPGDCRAWDPGGGGLGIGCYNAAPGQVQVHAPGYLPLPLEAVRPSPGAGGCPQAADAVDVVLEARFECSASEEPSVLVSVVDGDGALDGGATVSAASAVTPQDDVGCSALEDGRFSCVLGASGWIEVSAYGSGGGHGFGSVFVGAADCEPITEALTVALR